MTHKKVLSKHIRISFSRQEENLLLNINKFSSNVFTFECYCSCELVHYLGFRFVIKNGVDCTKE